MSASGARKSSSAALIMVKVLPLPWVCQTSPRVRFGIEGAADDRLHRAGLVLAQDVLVQLLVLLGEDDVVLEEGEHLRDGAEALDLGLQLADLLVLPVEDVAPHQCSRSPRRKSRWRRWR